MAQFNYRGTEVFLIVLLSMFLLMAYTIFRILPSTHVDRYREVVPTVTQPVESNP